jgi:hypothetical protein
MKHALKLAGLVGVSAAVTALLAAGANANTESQADARPPVFVQTDDPGGNRVVAYDRTRSGSLVFAGSYATGGRGGVLDGAVVDNTASRGALAYDRSAGVLFAVNAGSGTITTFAIHGDGWIAARCCRQGARFR